MKVGWKTRIYFYTYKYVTGPLLDNIVNLFQGFFILLDKATGNEIPPISDTEALREYRNRTNLLVNNVPTEFQALLPLAIKWGIGDDAIRGEVTEAATEIEKLELASSLSGKLGAIDKWIDSFPEDLMSDEAAAFMFMIEAVEELGLDIEYE
ncbi:MAG: hypothetical protein ABW124_09530 [Candidatus Thiodiazotropha sp. 6PLUC9]